MVYWATTVSVFVCGSTLRISPRDCGWTFGTAPLSNTLIVPFGSTLASCWKAVAAPLELDVECLPPMLVSTWPVCVSSSYSAEVLREEISVLPFASGSIEFRWK